MGLRQWQINSIENLIRKTVVATQDAGKTKSIDTRLKSADNHDLNAINEQIELNYKDSGQKNEAS